MWFVWVYLILAVCCQVFAMVGAVAQLGEHLLCKQGVSGSIPLSSTKSCPHGESLRTARRTIGDGLWPVFGGLLLAVNDIL